MSSSTILTTIAPQFNDDSERANFLALAESNTSRCYYGTKADEAVAYKAAHMMSLAGRGTGESGNVTSKREGDLEQRFAVNNKKGDPYLNQTHYGMHLQGLMNSSNLHIGVTGGFGRQC